MERITDFIRNISPFQYSLIFLGISSIASVIGLYLGLRQKFFNPENKTEDKCNEGSKSYKWGNFIKDVYNLLSNLGWVKQIALYFQNTSRMSNKRPNKGILNFIGKNGNNKLLDNSPNFMDNSHADNLPQEDKGVNQNRT